MNEYSTEKGINTWVKEITAWGKRKGWDKPKLCVERGRIAATDCRMLAPRGVNVERVLAKVALVHTELSEAVEHARDGRWVLFVAPGGKPDGFVVELADIVIRCFHIAGLLGLDLEDAIEQKMRYNESRAHRHGGRKA